MGLWTKKSIAVLQAEAAGESTEHTLRRALGALNLTTLGIGAIIGAGIFVLTGPLPRSTPGRESSYRSSSPDWDAFSRASVTPSSRA